MFVTLSSNTISNKKINSRCVDLLSIDSCNFLVLLMWPAGISDIQIKNYWSLEPLTQPEWIWEKLKNTLAKVIKKSNKKNITCGMLARICHYDKESNCNKPNLVTNKVPFTWFFFSKKKRNEEEEREKGGGMYMLIFLLFYGLMERFQWIIAYFYFH